MDTQVNSIQKSKKLVRKKKLYLQKVKDAMPFVQCLQEHS